MADFETLKNNANTAKEALKNKSEETKVALEKSFVDIMKSWEDAVIAIELESKTDTTKTTEASQARVDFDKFKNELEKEFKDILSAKEAENQANNKETQQQTNMLKDIITDQAYNLLLTYKSKTRIDIKNEQEFQIYINAFQIIITVLWASTHLWDTKENNKNIDNLWPITQAGVRTLQKYLNTTYMIWLEVDGKPGPKTLEALLAPVSDTDTTTRLEKMLADKPILSPLPIETIITKKVDKKKPSDKWTNKWWSKKEEVKTIKDANTEIPEKVIDTKFKELKKLYPKLDDQFLNAWAKAIISLKTWIIVWEFLYQDKTYYFDGEKRISRAKSKIIKTWEKPNEKKVDANIDSKTTIDKNIIKVNQKAIESGLNKYIHSNTISFEWDKNFQLYNEYYKNNIINLKKPTIRTYMTQSWSTRVSFSDDKWYVKYSIDLMAKDFIKKDTNDINYETIKEAIKKDIILKVQKEIEQKDSATLQKNYWSLKQYLEDTYFPINSLYSKQEQQNTFIKAFFEDFPRWIEFDKNDSILDNTNKRIKFEFDNNGNNKYWYGAMDINSKFTKDGKLDKEAIKRDIKSIINIKIKKQYPNFNLWNNYNK